jgi:hypothetical protein
LHPYFKIIIFEIIFFKMLKQLFVILLIVFCKAFCYGQYQFGWVKTFTADTILPYTASVGRVSGSRIITDTSDNLYTLTYFQGKAVYDSAFPVKKFTGRGMVLAKYSQNAKLLWAESFGDAISAQEMVCDKEGNCYLYGSYYENISYRGNTILTFMGGMRSTFACKIDKNGALVWVRNIGGIEADLATDMCIDDEENIYLAGRFFGTMDLDPGLGVHNVYSKGGGTFIIKLDANGNFVWGSSFATPTFVVGQRIAVDKNKSVIIAGSLVDSGNFNPTGTPYYLMKGTSPETYKFFAMLDSNGTLVWARKVANQGVWKIDDLQFDASGNFLLTAVFRGSSMAVTTSTGTKTVKGNAFDNYFIMKCDNAGELLWCDVFENNVEGYWWDWQINTDDPEYIHIVGKFEGWTDLDPGPAKMYVNAQKKDCVWMRLDTNGQNALIYPFGGQDDDVINDIAFDSKKNAYLIGSFKSPVDLDPTFGVHMVNNQHDEDLYYLKMTYCPPSNLNISATTDKDTICPGERVTLSASGGQQYIWSDGQDQQTIPVFPFATTNYYVIGKNTNGCVDTGSVSITVDSIISTQFIGSTIIDRPDSLVFYSVPPRRAGTYDWKVINGTILSGQGTTAIEVDWADNVINGRIEITITDTASGCSRFDVLAIQLTPLSIEKPDAPKLTIYPNPSSGNITIQSSLPQGKCTMIITDITGKTVEIINYQPNGNNFEVDVSSFATGIYYVLLNSDNGLSVGRFSKQ